MSGLSRVAREAYMRFVEGLYHFRVYRGFADKFICRGLLYGYRGFRRGSRGAAFKVDVRVLHSLCRRLLDIEKMQSLLREGVLDASTFKA